MKSIKLQSAQSVKGKIYLPGDKSISQRAVIISAISRNRTRIENLLWGEDCKNLIQVFKDMGIDIRIISRDSDTATVLIDGKGLYGLMRPQKALYLGNSGTAARLLTGLLSAQHFDTQITGDSSLSSRPMLRVILPLREMGAIVQGRKFAGNEYLPLRISPPMLIEPVSYNLPVASAQIKSAILLAGLYANGKTTVFEPIESRDHTERMLRNFGVKIIKKNKKISIRGCKELKSPGVIYVPSDISSAAYFIAAALILKKSDIVIKDVGVNPGRTGILDVLKRMGADIKITDKRIINSEPVSDIRVRSSALKGTMVNEEEIPRLIDEIPLIMVLSCFAKGKTTIKGVQELRVKETDRIQSMTTNLIKMGARIEIRKTGKREDLIIDGVVGLKGTKMSSFGDHRTVMSMAIAALAADGDSAINNVECINKSFPTFFIKLKSIIN